MKKRTKLNEALTQFSLASKILKEDYGMGPGMEYDGESRWMAQKTMMTLCITEEMKTNNCISTKMRKLT